jgi:hypothetical protein
LNFNVVLNSIALQAQIFLITNSFRGRQEESEALMIFFRVRLSFGYPMKKSSKAPRYPLSKAWEEGKADKNQL